MKKVLIIISIFSLSIAGTGYMAYDFDETENDIALVQGDISPLKNGQRIVILYSDTVRVLPFDG